MDRLLLLAMLAVVGTLPRRQHPWFQGPWEVGNGSRSQRSAYRCRYPLLCYLFACQCRGRCIHVPPRRTGEPASQVKRCQQLGENFQGGKRVGLRPSDMGLTAGIPVPRVDLMAAWRSQQRTQYGTNDYALILVPKGGLNPSLAYRYDHSPERVVTASTCGQV
jgi:hypothetical protein